MNDLKGILTRINERGLKAGGAISSSVIDQLRKYRQKLSIFFGSVTALLLVALACIIHEGLSGSRCVVKTGS